MSEQARNFIEQIIDADIASGRWGPPGERAVVRTRFPPEPNGYLHIGHAKSIAVNFGLAEQFGGSFNLRFDDTNPAKEEQEFVDSIVRDVRWLGARWDGMRDGDHHAGVLFASDYFERMHDWAVDLIRKGLAYVDDQTAEEIRRARGDLRAPGTPSPWRDRPVAENLDLFARMVAGEFPDGSRVLRAKIDMASANVNLRDPVMYRVVNAEHHRTGSRWHVYPMYDWAHGLEDSIEGITHSICTLEFEDHRPLYDWFIEAINRDRGPGAPSGPRIHHPQQIEFARLNPTFLVTSKRFLRALVEEQTVESWDDPRMPTISGMRRRGMTPEALRAFAVATGLTKFNAKHDLALLENAVRDDLNRCAPRCMAVLRPLRVVITNWAEGGDPARVEHLSAVNNPEDPNAGGRTIPFGAELWIERDDFMEQPPKGFFRLAPGAEVRLRYAYWITCREVVKDERGQVVELRCTYDPLTRGGDAPPPDASGKVRKVKGTIHWVHAPSAAPATVRLIDRLFNAETPGKRTGELLDDLNPDAIEVIERAWVEPAWGAARPWELFADGIARVQFERLGYFAVDHPGWTAPLRGADAQPWQRGPLVFNRVVTLKDSWAKDAKPTG